VKWKLWGDTRPARKCPHCERNIGFLKAKLHGPFCSSDCRLKYREAITKLALERLNARMLIASGTGLKKRGAGALGVRSEAESPAS
jgi:hypothetical protein